MRSCTTGARSKAELAKALPQLTDPRDRALLEAMCFSALRQRARYDAALKSWLQKPLGQKDGELRALLLAGFAQIDAMGLPAHAALSVTVEATRALGRPHQAGMVNALLRRAQREGFPEADVCRRLARVVAQADRPGLGRSQRGHLRGQRTRCTAVAARESFERIA